MKKVSLKNLKLEADDLLQRNQLKSVLGGGYGNGVCQNDADPIPFYWSCDGQSGSGYTCPEHYQATIDFYLAYCNS
tara:strand:+ start:87706 stop:87933 length:228 start_codon:yes stop_codon:yes gene_type:complete